MIRFKLLKRIFPHLVNEDFTGLVPPNQIIGTHRVYMRRWFLSPIVRGKRRWYLHNFVNSDDDRALHDHPAASVSIILWNGYYEHTADGKRHRRWPGQIIFRKATDAHRIELFMDIHERPKQAWTLFRFAPKEREWGFLCPKGWRHWRDFTAGENGESIGKGCAD